MAMGNGGGFSTELAGRLMVAALLIAPAVAAADGERTPMMGGALLGAAAHKTPLAGAGLEATWWHWRFGLSAEGSMMWSGDDVAKRVTMLGGSARLLVFDALVESFLEPRDVELGIELQGIIERAWWTDDSSQPNATRYGVGVALRLRGASDYDLSNLLAESRVFVRVMTAAVVGDPTIARMTTPPPDRDTGQLMILIGLGAAWGTGDPDYLERFRMEPFSPAARRLAGTWFER